MRRGARAGQVEERKKKQPYELFRFDGGVEFGEAQNVTLRDEGHRE